ncbi:DUF58 domain-containing protein [Brevibacillus sp. NL20B1]|jgi:uncharacterized protein (DUF58 family)|uniref:DUF58 domain-containing protein n=1 Tax=Brevibacillus sp. NL20B1 TaxID=2829799 RepID=UPI001B8E4357|nr:DUF58 domain-containing protein [Brevibacillus sp. NL20B1]MBR8658966.1 DUF58 domain-containing protein [Brevibacillus sp. NL20B1]
MKELISGKSKALVLIAITYAFAKFQGGFASWFLFYSCLVFLAYEVLAFSLMFTGLEVEREIDRSRLQEGEDVIVTVRLKRRIWFPLGWNMVIEPLPERLAGVYEPHRQLVFPWFKRSVEFRYVIPGLPRGYYHLEACVISGGDFFGFIERRRTFPLSNDLLVYPRYRELNSWSLGDGNFSGTIHVSHRYSDDVAAVRGVRDYQRGDRMSQIHWRASARGTGLKTKEFEHQAMNQVVFFLDVEKEHYQNKPFQLFETAVKLTASLTAYANRNQYHYGLVYKQKDRVAIPPACSPTHFFRVFDQLARVMPEGTDSFVRILRREALEQPPGVTLTVITACLDKELVDLLTRLSHRGRRVQLLYVHDDPLLSLDEKQALRLLASGRVTCKAVPMSDVEEWKRIGGA